MGIWFKVSQYINSNIFIILKYFLQGIKYSRLEAI